MSLPSLQNFDKSTWQKLPFGEIAQSIGERVDPTTTDLQIYVGLEHIDAESIHIKRFGKREDVSGTKLRCYPGDVIFGRRRAYQRKAAICEFDGFCSAHSLVLRAIPEVIDPKLFPFFLHSDQFMHRAVDISVGGLSPTINWTKLKKEEFLIPPKDQQAKLAELLWAANDSVEHSKLLRLRLRESLNSLLNFRLIHGISGDEQEPILTKCGLLDPRINVMQLRECLAEKPSYGANASSKSYEPDSPRYIRITDIDDEGNLIEDSPVSIDLEDYDDYLLQEGDFLFARTGNTVGKTLLYRAHHGPAVYAGYLIRFRLDRSKLNPEFLLYYSKSLKYESFKRKMIKVGAQPNINSEEYQSMHLPAYNVETQDHIVSELKTLEAKVQAADCHGSAAQKLLKSLINQIF